MDDKFNQLVQEFKNPSLDYSPVVMWFWNGDIDEDGITFQLEKFREQNIVSFFIHYCVGCTLEYLSDRHRELIQYVVKEAKRLGMYYWIYDEYEYPSGTAGGQILEKYPEYRQKEITCVKEVLNPCGMRVSLYKRGQFLCAQSMKEKKGKRYMVDVTDLCEVKIGKEFVEVDYQNHCTVPETILFFFVTLNETDTLAGICAPGTKGLRGYLNSINKDAVGKFIELTHEWYKEAVGEEFGKTVKGVFTDEPTSLRHFSGPHPGPWDDGFLEIFEEEHGYSLIPYIYALFYEPITAEEAKARDDYRTTVKHLYQKNFVKQSADWCRANNLIYTGHFGGEEELFGSVAQGDMQTGLMYMDIPGLDSIFPTYKIDNNNYNIAGKLVSSAAKYINADRVLCETFTGSGWHTDFPLMRRVVNRLTVLGVNMLQYMGAHYSLRDSRKKDMLPSSHGYINPLFKKYHIFNEYVAGLSALSAATRPDSKVLVMNPLRQAIQCLNVMDTRVNTFTFPQQILYEDTVNSLLHEGIDFDLFSEDLVENITVYDGYVEAFGYRYEYMVLPAMRYVNESMAKLLKKLKEHQVTVLFIEDVAEHIAETMGNVDFDFQGTAWPDRGAEVQKDGSAYLITKGSQAVMRKAFREIIGNVALNLESDAKVYIASRANDCCKLYFICNDEDRNVTAAIDSVPGMKIYNTTDRKEANYPVENSRVKLTLAPYDMLVVLVDKNSHEPYVPTFTEYARKNDIPVENDFVFEAVGGNILPLTSYEVYDKDIDEWVRGDDFLGFPQGMYLEQNELYQARTEVFFEYIPAQIYLNAEIYSIKSLKLNGTEVSLFVNTRRFGEADCRCDVTKLLKKGRNTVEMEVMTDRVYVSELIPFLFFTGKFAVDNYDKAVKPKDFIACGGWEKQGYPYFCGDGVYKTRVSVFGMDNNTFCRPWKKAVMKINATCAAEIYVNGICVGTNIWKPGEIDITGALHTNTNEITIKLTSTLSNLMRPKSNFSPFHTENTVNGIVEPIVITLFD